MGWLETYHGMEDAWYALLDKVDQKVPVYAVVDPVEKVVLTFAILLGLVAVLLVGGLWMVFSATLGGGGTLTLLVVDEEGLPAEGAVVYAQWVGGSQKVIVNGVGKATLTNVPQGTEISLKMEHPDFAAKTQFVTLEEKDVTISIVLLLKEVTPNALTFYFADKSGASLEGKEISVQLSCSSGEAWDVSLQKTELGVITITPPKNCDTVLGDIYGVGFEEKNGVILKANTPIIALDTLNVEKSTLKITVKQADSAKLLNGIQVEFFTKEGLSVETRYTNSLGVTIFENVAQGIYYASASDPSGEFALITSENILLETTAGEAVELSMKRATQGSLVVSVTDKDTTAKLANATLKLVRKSDNQLIQTYLTKEGETPTLSVDEKGPFLLYATHAEYLSEVKEITSVNNQSTISFALEKLTAQNSGRVLVHVVDEDGVPVENAQVVIYDAASKFIAQQYSPKITNATGDASFVGILSGNYFARIMKYPAAASDSPNFSSKLNELTTVNATLKVGTAILRVRITDEQNQPIPFAKVVFFTEGGSECDKNKCTVDADVLGVASYTFKADRKIYARVTSPGFLNYTTLTYALKPGLPITIPVTLPRSISGSTPKIIVKEIVDATTGVGALQLDKGKSYRWVFQLYIPDEMNGLQEAGVHVRVGDDKHVESENAYILSTIGAQTTSMSGTSYQPDLGWDEDEENLVSGGENAKWTQLTWNNPQPGVYEGAVVFYVSSNASLLDTIPIHYRAWGVLGSTWSRDPYDLELGENEESGGKESLYADAYTRMYTVGKPLACTDVVCYGSELLENLDTGMITKKEPFSTIALNEYRYSFVVSGGSANGLSNARIRVITQGENGSQSGPVIDTYTFENVPGSVVSESGLSTHDVDGGNGLGVSVGTISSTQTMLGTIDFTASTDASSEMEIQIISNGDIVFERTIAFASSGFQNLTISSNPSAARAFIAGTFDIHVTDDEGFDVAGARVRVTKMDSSQNQFVLVEQYTDVFGHTTIQTPASLPGTRFIVEASRGNESADVLTITVSSNVVEFDPEELSFVLDAVPNADAFLPFDVKNVAQEELTLISTFITGDFQGLLSLDDMQNWLNQYHGNLRLGADTVKTIQMKASTPESLSILSGKNLTGNVVILFENASGTSTWVQSIPFMITLAIPTQCDGEAIQLSGASSSGSIQLSSFDDRVEKEFQILNICEVDGKMIDLHNLQAKVNWKSTPIGSVELSIVHPEDGTQTLEALRNGFYTPLFETFNTANQAPYEAVLTFTPYPRHIGETAEFTITIAAQTGQGNETELVSESFDMKIRVTNYESCIKFDVDKDAGLVIGANESETQFSVDTSECGDVGVDIFFCPETGNKNCSGGASLGKIYLQEKISQLKGNKTVRVERKTTTLPGTYDITVHAGVTGESPRRISTIPLFVTEKTTYAFESEKTSFNLYEVGAVDSTLIVNRLMEETVDVRASICDWDDSNKRDARNYAPFILGTGFIFIDPVIGGLVMTTLYFILNDYDFKAAWHAFWDMFSDPCDDHDNKDLPDFIIKLAQDVILPRSVPADAIDVVLSPELSSHFSAEWELDTVDVATIDEKRYEHVGVNVKRTGTPSSPLPRFGVMTLRAKEHIHGDMFHAGNAAVHCSNGGFGRYYVGGSGKQGDCDGASDVTREERYHIKITTTDTRPVLQPTTFDGAACESPTGGVGVTGPTALPRVKFAWNWNDSTGITWNACDAENANAIYCDATQFNIMMQKRLKILDNFLAANEYNFECPSLKNTTPDSGVFTRPTPVPSGFIGYHSFGYSFQGPTVLSFSGTIENSTNSNHIAVMSVTLTPIGGAANASTGGGATRTCDSVITVPSNESFTAQCSIADLETGLYTLEFDLASATTSNIATVSNVRVINSSQYEPGFGETCDGLIKTTALIGGKPGISRWMNRNDPQYGNTINDNPIFTPEVPDVDALRKLVHFDAYLMADGYTNDFENDFRDYYSSSQFADAPTWFKGPAGLSGFNSFYGNDDALKFTQKYFDSPSLSVSGKYRVDLDVTFNEEWNLIDSSGAPASEVKVVFYLLSSPSPDSPFYYLPFNGRVGELSGAYDRIGYGLEYVNANTPNVVNEQAPLLSGEGSSAVRKLTIQPAATLQRMNSIPSSRGGVLDVAQANGANYSIQFTPSMATPLVLKTTHGMSEVPFSIFYQIDSGSGPISTGNTFTFWEGAGNCYDYTGIPVWEKFNYSPDRAGTTEDKLSNYQNLYALDWPRSVLVGDVFLRTILYTPSNENFSFKTHDSTTKVFTANYAAPSTGQLLDGISTMRYNNASEQIQTIEDVFSLVENQKMCIGNSGNHARFFWNPSAVYSTVGQMNVSAFTNGLVAGQTCLGPPN